MHATIQPRTTHHLQAIAVIPAPRRLPAALAITASAGVFATSLHALPAPVLIPLAAAWITAFAAGALAPRTVILTVMAALVKAATIALVIWAVTHPHSALGPHTALDWVPLGLLNSSTGLWLHAVIRHRAR
jgi:hypothetical protein